MLDKISQLQKEAEAFDIKDEKSLEAFRLAFISKKGKLTSLFDELKSVPREQKKEVGMSLNKLKVYAKEKFDTATQEVQSKQGDKGEKSDQDLTLPSIPHALGSRHPLTIVKERIVEIFARMGFNLSEGPEIEDDWHNFTALNFPENHPAREMQDTFFIERKPDITLRTHTSSVQVRVMENQKPPIRTLSPGRVFRNEAISARAHCVFHQIEGLYIDEKVSFADLKQTLYYFVKEMFGKDIKVRFRPSFFPFTEPSAEMDITCLICKGKGCNICKQSGWVEIGGAGMVDPNVLQNCGIDPEKYSGFAFGMGIERITMLKYQIKDLRLFTENDVRFLRQFTHL
ncbi:phenylalanine--tRNA ligase subunit alpha [Cytophagaceae bacterium ABcell3]|nr:phenylalanine--tRNA ligase subunit alpha [Cytophagaceae bacterium ABcell3]